MESTQLAGTRCCILGQSPGPDRCCHCRQRAKSTITGLYHPSLLPCKQQFCPSGTFYFSSFYLLPLRSFLPCFLFVTSLSCCNFQATSKIDECSRTRSEPCSVTFFPAVFPIRLFPLWLYLPTYIRLCMEASHIIWVVTIIEESHFIMN